jgi:tRNA G18 (ribose-2'-O)-methylase SpoU
MSSNEYRSLNGGRLVLESERDLTSIDRMAIIADGLPASPRPVEDNDPRWAWRRNVLPEYQGLTTEEIQAKIKQKQLPFIVAVENLQHDFNVGSIIRNANAFGASAIYYIGIKHLDRRSCCGVQNYSTITHLKSIAELKAAAPGYTLVGVENNVESSKPIDDYEYPDKTMLVFGTEVGGLSKEMMAECKDIIHIIQRGSVPSINAAAASAVVMNDFATKHKRKNDSRRTTQG